MRLAHPLESPRLVLMTLEVSEVDGSYLRWMKDAEVLRYLEARHAPPDREALRAYVAAAIDSSDTLLLAIRMRADDRHIGNLKLGPIDRPNRRAELGLLLGDAECRGIGLGREAIALAARFAFEDLGLHKLTAGYLEPNVASGRAFEAAGFVEEARLPEHFLFEGRWIANVRLGRIASTDDRLGSS